MMCTGYLTPEAHARVAAALRAPPRELVMTRAASHAAPAQVQHYSRRMVPSPGASYRSKLRSAMRVTRSSNTVDRSTGVVGSLTS